MVSLYANHQYGPFLFKTCSSLERLSIKNIRFVTCKGEEGDITQEMLIKMVHNQATVRWLKSDLSDENITMLQRE